jgi:hypothetical protein
MEKYTEEQILMSYKGRCLEESKEAGYCGSCSIEIHRRQLSDPTSWVQPFVLGWAREAIPSPTTGDLAKHFSEQLVMGCNMPIPEKEITQSILCFLAAFCDKHNVDIKIEKRG